MATKVFGHGSTLSIDYGDERGSFTTVVRELKIGPPRAPKYYHARRRYWRTKNLAWYTGKASWHVEWKLGPFDLSGLLGDFPIQGAP